MDYGSLAMDSLGRICSISDAETHELLYMSKACLELCGLQSLAEVQGKPCYEVFEGRSSPCDLCSQGRMPEGELCRKEWYNQDMERWFDITHTYFRKEGRLCRLELARDITARKQGASLEGDEVEMEDVLFRCLHTMAEELDLDRALNQFLRSVGEYYWGDRAYIIEFDLDTRLTYNTFEWCREGVTPEIDNLQGIPMSVMDEVWFEAFEEHNELSFHTLRGTFDPEGEVYRILSAQGIQGILAVPLRREGQLVGFLGVDDPRRNLGDMTLLHAVAEFILSELEKRRLMAELERMSYIDVLTSLRNRNDYNRTLHAFDRQTPETLGVILLDINGLKEINNTHGHDYGDHIICQVSEFLSSHFGDGVYRIGGDEFAVLCTNLPKQDFKDAVVDLRRTLDQSKDFSIALGFAWKFDEDSVDVNLLLLQAEEMRRAEKQSYYHTVLREGREVFRGGFADEVLREIEAGRFFVCYQPQVNIQSGEVVGAEALVRKRDETGSVIPPGKFLPFYEVGGVISHIDLFVLRTACADLRGWMAQGHNLRISVNFSRATLLEPHIVEVISGICAANHVPSTAVTIEVTESIGKMDNEQLRDLIEQLKKAGFSISLDDFGSQYSNLAILASMDFDEVKFDRSLVSTLEDNEKSRVVMESSMGLCRALKGTASLAEGIETQGQLDLLTEYRCDYGQGYFFSRPIPLDEFNAFMEEHKGKHAAQP